MKNKGSLGNKTTISLRRKKLSGKALIEIRELCYARGRNAIFDGLTIDITRGAITAIMGPSGTGKTTLLRLITGQLRQHSGDLRVAGSNVCELSRRDLYAMRSRMGVLFQNSALLTQLTVYENVAFPLRAHTQLPESLIRQMVMTKLHAVGLRGAYQLMPSQLSGGMARRIALARALITDPEILLYDEPFVGLDPISKSVISRLIQRIHETLPVTSVIISHDVAELEAIADFGLILSEGRVLSSGTPAELARSSSPSVRQFMLGLADGPIPFHYSAPEYEWPLSGRMTT